ncbi:MAG: hypothetical protein ACTSQ5_10905 [Promethearchaeota archaeon]
MEKERYSNVCDITGILCCEHRVHYPISAASSFIAVACVLIMHKFVPEFIMSLIWIGDELKAMIKGRTSPEEDLDEVPSEITQEEKEEKEKEKKHEDYSHKAEND